MPPAALARAREVLQRLERYELDVFAEEAETEQRAIAAGASASSAVEETALSKAATNAARRRIAAQSSLFDLANQRIVDDLRAADVEEMSADEAKDLLRKLQDKII
jgi:hypothetical protein